MRPLKIGKKDNEKGQSLTEFALVIPILILLLVGIVEIGWGMNSYLTVVDAARDGARLGAKGTASDSEIVALVMKETERLEGGIPASGVTIVRDNSDPTNSTIEVEVCYDHALIMGVPQIIPDPLVMCSTTTMQTVNN